MNWITVKKWYYNGIERLKWFASLFSERLQVELAILKILNNMDELKRKRSGYAIKIGDRVVKLRNSSSYDLFADSDVKSLLKEIDLLDKEIGALQEKAEELSKLGN